MGRYFSKFIIKSLFVVALLEPAYALPTCPKNLPMDKWTNCHGAIGDYVGGFKNGQPFGQGKVYMGDGILYATFENNGVNGNFTFTHPDCEIKGVARTDGEIGNPDSTVYANGEMNCRDGLRYIGEFVNMWPQGKGTIFGVNGDIYVGKVKELIPHGWGKLTAKNGTVQEGMWNNGKFSEVTKLQISFNNLPKVKRRQLQSILKKLNYYKYSIDGLYGKGTETALKEYNKSFLTSNPLDQEKNIQKLFAAINNHFEIKEAWLQEREYKHSGVD